MNTIYLSYSTQVAEGTVSGNTRYLQDHKDPTYVYNFLIFLKTQVRF